MGRSGWGGRTSESWQASQCSRPSIPSTARCTSALRAAGCREAFLYTHEQNERALRVYASAGYRPDGSIRESDFRGTRMREVRLVKHLDNLETNA